jgi:tetratricopeptide (TPR) repeat protein
MLKRAIGMLLAGVVMAGGTGCAKDGAAAMSRSDADRLKNEKAKAEFIQDRPLTAESHFAAGQVAEMQGDQGRAVEQYELALKIDPKQPGSLFRMALIYTSQQQFAEAVETWNRYIAATGNSASGYNNLGLCLELADRLGDAETAYKAGITREPTNRPCRVNYGLMLARHGRMAEATQQWQAVLLPAEVHYNLASVLESQGHTDQAKVEYRKSLELDPAMSDAKARLASLSND